MDFLLIFHISLQVVDKRDDGNGSKKGGNGNVEGILKKYRYLCMTCLVQPALTTLLIVFL